jgi:hypothetical protein
MFAASKNTLDEDEKKEKVDKTSDAAAFFLPDDEMMMVNVCRRLPSAPFSLTHRETLLAIMEISLTHHIPFSHIPVPCLPLPITSCSVKHTAILLHSDYFFASDAAFSLGSFEHLIPATHMSVREW